MTSPASPFTESDLAQLDARGISPHEAAHQLHLLRAAPAPIRLDRPCTLGDGIVRLAPPEQEALLGPGDAAIHQGRVMKFVPASGAATRMFKDLIAALEGDGPPSASETVATFFDRFDDFPFAAEARRRSGVSGPLALEDDQRTMLRTLLVDMRYADLPKALIPFHGGRVIRTAFEEQLLEAAAYARDGEGRARIHFTVPPDYRQEFERLLAEVTPRLEESHPGIALSVGFSEQHPATDTLAATPDGEPFRLADGSLLFRPAGHGALLRNLQALDGDIVVIKNIDNVRPHAASDDVVRWKRLLIGVLVTMQQQICELVVACEQAEVEDAILTRALKYATTLAWMPPAPLEEREARRAFVLDALKRPLRVCGVVRNEGEPGGAPFWVIEPTGARSAQIVESSQVDLADEAQRRIFESSTHFNPVDLVCAVRACDGAAFDLSQYVDPDAVFLSSKSHEGRDLVALERPGLWNGAMAGWNTAFVEVPGSTFAPVKTVLDLLRHEHQSL